MWIYGAGASAHRLLVFHSAGAYSLTVGISCQLLHHLTTSWALSHLVLPPPGKKKHPGASGEAFVQALVGTTLRIRSLIPLLIPPSPPCQRKAHPSCYLKNKHGPCPLEASNDTKLCIGLKIPDSDLPLGESCPSGVAISGIRGGHQVQGPSGFLDVYVAQSLTGPRNIHQEVMVQLHAERTPVPNITSACLHWVLVCSIELGIRSHTVRGKSQL